MVKNPTKSKTASPVSNSDVSTESWFDLDFFSTLGKTKLIAWSVIVFFVGFLLFANTINHDYALDDTGAIAQNLNVQEGIKGIPKILKMDLWEFSDVKLGYYRPLSLITFAIEIEFFGNAPHVSHFNNVLIFALSGVFLFLVLQQIFGKFHQWLPLIATLLFIAHPIHTEVVANIKSRDELLSFLNLFVVLFFVLRHIKTKKWWYLPFVFVFSFLGMLSKETALTGLVLVPVFYYIFDNQTILQSALKSVSVFLAIFFFFVQKKMALGTLEANIPVDIINYPYIPPHVNESAKFSMAFYLFGFGLNLLILPITLRYDYSYNQIPAVDFSNPLALVGLLVFFIGAYFTVKLILNKKMLGIPLAIFYLNFGPALAFTILRGGIFAERFLFTSTLGFVLLLVIGLIELGKKINLAAAESTSKQAIPLFVVCGIIFSLYSFKTIDRNKVWKDNYTLFSTDLKTGQNSAQNQRHFAEQTLVLAMEEKDSVKQLALAKESLKGFKISLKMHPKFAESYLKAAVVYQLYLKDADKAIENYKKCIACEPSRNLRSEAYYNLGTVYQNDKADFMYASYCYNQALVFNPSFQAAIAARDALKKVGINNLLEPINQKVDTLNGEKDANYYFSIAYDLASKGDYMKAIENFNEVLKMNPSSLDALLNVGNCYGMLGDYQKSISYNNKIIKYYPNDKRPWKNNAINYEKLGDKVKMQECLNRANATY
ncbi:MAG: tetratricopeptide repeat protein [Flavobacteriales bacterium]|nr:tetratricopeptide repeat protein [Flavobacteriales bacterium]